MRELKNMHDHGAFLECLAWSLIKTACVQDLQIGAKASDFSDTLELQTHSTYHDAIGMINGLIWRVRSLHFGQTQSYRASALKLTPWIKFCEN